MQHPIVYGDQYGSGVRVHGYTDMPIIVAGGCGGQFKMGRLFEATPRLAANPDANGKYDASQLHEASGVGGLYAGVPHNALLTAIINAFEKNRRRTTRATRRTSWRSTGRTTCRR